MTPKDYRDNFYKSEALRKEGKIDEARAVELYPSDRMLLEKRIAASAKSTNLPKESK